MPVKPSDTIIGPMRGTAAAFKTWGEWRGVARLVQFNLFADTLWDMYPITGIDPIIPAGGFGVETGDGNTMAGQLGGKAWLERLNPASIGITGYTGGPDSDNMMWWPDGAAAARAYLAHLWAYAVGTDPHWDYDNERVDMVLADPKRRGKAPRLQDLGGLYADAKDYGVKVANRANSYFVVPDQKGTAVTTARLTVLKNLLPEGVSNNPRTKLDTSLGWIGVTCHQTGNPSYGADADNQIMYMHTDEGRMRQVAFHLAVDDYKIAQGLTLDRIGWHAADGCDNWAVDSGCFRTIAIEGCIDAGANYVQAIHNYAICIAMLVAGDDAFDWGDGRAKGKVSPNHLYQHLQVSDLTSDQHFCPEQLLRGVAGITWTKFLGLVDEALDGFEGAGGSTTQAFGPIIKFVTYKIGHTVKSAVSRKEATAASSQVRPYKEGTSLRLVGSRTGQKAGESNRWYRISSPGGPSNGAWIHESALAEVTSPTFVAINSVVGHAIPGAVTRIAAQASAEQTTQFKKRTALRLIGYQEGQEINGSNKWYVIHSKGPSNETLIHASGLEQIPDAATPAP